MLEPLPQLLLALAVLAIGSRWIWSRLTPLTAGIIAAGIPVAIWLAPIPLNA